MADLKGMKIRAGGGPTMDTVVALGATGISLHYAEITEALEKGVVEGVFIGAQGLKSVWTADYCKFMTLTWYGGFDLAILMNLDTYNRLPPDIRKVFDELFNGPFREHMIWSWEQTEEVGWDYGRETGVEYITLSAEEKARWDATVTPVLDKWASDKDAKGLPGRAILDEFIRLVKKHR